MSENTNPFEGDAPLLPGGEPELAGTGPQGAYPDGSPEPGEPVVDDVNAGDGDDVNEGSDVQQGHVGGGSRDDEHDG